VISDFEPCTSFELAKVSTGMANHSDYFGDDSRLGSLGVSLRVSLYEDPSESTEATIADMIETVLASTTNYRVFAWLESHPKP
jgi:hypothetical protein